MSECVRFSRRLSWDSPPNEVSRHVQALRAAGVPLLDLTVSNPTSVLPGYPHRAIASTYGALSDLTYRPEPAGGHPARQAVSEYYARRQVSIHTDRILLTASTSEGYALLFKLLCDPGDEVLVPTPSYPLFEYLAGLEAVSLRSYSLHYDGSWYVDLEQLRRSIGPVTRAVVLVNPNNPTGSYWKKGEARAVLDAAAQAGVPVISDEVFTDYSLDATGECVRTFAEFPASFSFCLNGLSKIAAMPQIKLGWMLLNGSDEQVAPVRERLELLLDTYLSVSTPAAAALPDLLRIGEEVQASLKKRIERNYSKLQKLLSGTSATPLPAEGGWSAIVRLPQVRTEEEWVLLLLQRFSVVTQPGYFFDLVGGAHIVLSLITAEEVFAEALGRLVQALLIPG